MSLSSIVDARSVVEFCPAYTSVSQLAVDVTKPFIQYTLGVEDTGTGRKTLVVTGDVLLINRDTLGVIVRTAASADRTIANIKLHGRVVRFQGVVPVIAGSVEVLADTIYFEDGSAISVLPDKTSQVILAANKLILAPSGFRHFDVRARQVTNARDDFSDIAKILSISTDSILVGDTPVAPTGASDAINKRFSRYPVTDFTSKIDIALEAQGHQRWIASHKAAAAAWPKYSLAVLRAAFRVAPFDECTKADVVKGIKSLLPSLQELGSGESQFEAQTIVNSIAGGYDLDGNGPAFAPNRPLGDLLGDIKGYQTGGNKLATLDFYSSVLSNAIADTPVSSSLQSAQIGALNENIRQSTVEYQNTNNELVAMQTQIGATLKLLGDQQTAYSAREQRLKEYEADLKKGAQDRAQIISALSTAAAIATTAYTGNPQTGAAVGGVIYAIGEAGEGKKPFESLSAGIQFARAVEAPLTAVSKTVSELKASRGNYEKFIESFSLSNVTIKSEIDVPAVNPKPGDPLTTKFTRDQALKDLAGKASALKDGVDSLQKVYNDFTPKPAPVSAVVEEDDSLKDLATRIAITLDEVKKLTTSLESIHRRVQEQSVALVANAERLALLTTVPVNNEARRRLYGQLAIEGARDEVSKFASLIDQIRRVSIVEFRAPLPVSPSLIQSAFVAERIDKGFDEQTVLTSKDVGSAYLEQLNGRKTQINILAEFVASASEKQFRQYVSDRGSAPTIVSATEDISDSPGSPPNDRRFIRQLNELVEAQFNALKDPIRLQALYARQLELPLDVRAKIDQRFPTRLLQVAITDIQPRFNLGGGDIVFRVEVERVGNLRKAATGALTQTMIGSESAKTCAAKAVAATELDCFAVDLRTKSTPPEFRHVGYEYTIGRILSGAAFSPTPAQSFWYIKSGDSAPTTGRTMMVTYSPAEARMFLKLRLDPNTSWNNAPKFNRLRVTAEVFQ